MGAGWPLIGRTDELDLLRDTTAPAAGGVLLAGPAGVGKTRLAGEIFNLWHDRGRQCRWFVATRSARSVPLGVFADFIDCGTADSLLRIRSTVAALTESTDGDRVLLVIDDAHLLDDQSALVVHQIVRHDRADVLLTMRSGQTAPDTVSGLWKDQLIARLDVQPLAHVETTELLTRVLGGHIESTAATGLWRLTRGNVLHLRYLIENERAAGRLTRRDNVWVWDARPEISAPLAELIDADIARQPATVLAVVDILAVADPVEIDVLTALCAPEAVEAAHNAGLVLLDTAAPAPLARLAHPLLGEVRRARNLPARLRALRGTVARELENRYVTDEPVMLVRRAVLMCDSDLTPDAELLIAAAHAALHLSDPGTAEHLARRAIAAGGGYRAHRALVGGLLDAQRYDETHELTTLLAESATLPQQRLAMAVLGAVIEITTMGACEQSLTSLESDAAALGSTGIHDAARAYVAAFRTQPELAVEAAQKALDSAGSMNEHFELLAVMGLTAGNAMLGRYSAMAAPAQRGYTISRSNPTVTGYLLLGFHHLMGLYTGGYLTEATRLVGRLTCQAPDLPQTTSYNAFIRGLLATAHGDLATAVAHCREARAVSASAPSHWGHSAALLDEIITTAMRGDAADAAALLAQYRPPGPAPEALRTHNVHLIAQAWASAAAGITSHAITLAVRAAEMARELHYFAYEVLCRQNAVQFGDHHQSSRLTELAATVEGPRAAAAALHATSLETGDPGGLCEAARLYEQFGDRVAAGDAAAHAANSLRAKGLRGAALTAAARAERLATATGAATPAQRALRCPSPLTARQREVIALVAAGLSNRQIAERLVTSVRTVEGHLFRASQRTGINNREALAALLDHTPETPSAD